MKTTHKILLVGIAAILIGVAFISFPKQDTKEVIAQEQVVETPIENEIETEEDLIDEFDINLTIGKYVDLDDENDIEQLEAIVENTPLELETAYIIMSYSRKFDVQPSLILAMIELESNFDQYCKGNADDRGYLQIIPGTEEWLIDLYGDELGFEYNPENIYDADYNIGLGVAYISLLKNAYGEEYDRILSEYNRGPYNLKKYYESNNTYETAYSRSILSREKKYTGLN